MGQLRGAVIGGARAAGAHAAGAVYALESYFVDLLHVAANVLMMQSLWYFAIEQHVQYVVSGNPPIPPMV